MVKIWLLSLALFQHSAQARSLLQSHQISDQKVGTLSVEIEDVVEPIATPLRMTLRLKCAAGRTPFAAKDGVLLREKICEFRGLQYDEKSKTVTIQYTNLGEAMAECENAVLRTAELLVLCPAPKN